MDRPSLDTERRERLRAWLDTWEFRANPFEHNRAEAEPDLESYFIPTPAYNEARRGVSSLIFAGKGCGKTAHLLMLARNARPQDPHSKVLAAQYIQFGALLPALDTNPIQVSTEQHVAQILRLASHNLLQSLLEYPGVAAALPGEWLATFAWFCETYRPAPAGPREAIAWMRGAAEHGAALEWIAFRQAVTERRVARYLDGLGISEPSCVFLARLLDAEPEPPFTTGLAPAALVAFFASLLPPAGLEHLHVLVGGLEDVMRFAHNLADLVEFVYPLLSDLHLMNLARVSFTFLLPGGVYDYLERGKTAQLLERLAHRRITWSKADISDMFIERLTAHRPDDDDAKEIALAGLCAPSLAPTIERDIFELAKGAPSQAISLCNALLQAHCSRASDSQHFASQDWWLMIEQVYNLPQRDGRVLTHPPLRVNQKERKIFVGNDEKVLPDSLYSFLMVFYKHPDRWLKWHEIDKMTDIKLSDVSFRKYLSRLRKIIEPNPEQPVYLVTKRGHGVRLENAWPELD
ncbi:MAG: hypothetical protein JXB47_15470 [Anaerolineae bacterium]|nr:hypothetical protein [Anaerolineae bacterium]